MKLIFDLEANGLLDVYPVATKIWCIVTQDVDTGYINKYVTEEIAGGLFELWNADEIIGHNIIDYDLALIQKLYPLFHYEGKVFDTMILSQLLFPERPGGHSLASFGKSLGIQKPEHEDWSQFSPEMLNRCTEDVKINYEVYKLLKKEAYEDIEGVPYGSIY